MGFRSSVSREFAGERTNFFVFADTVATSNHEGTNEAHRLAGHPISGCADG
jgi:hypothetical protein